MTLLLFWISRCVQTFHWHCMFKRLSLASMWVIVVVMIYYNPALWESWVKPATVSVTGVPVISEIADVTSEQEVLANYFCHYKCFAALKPSQKWYWFKKCSDDSVPSLAWIITHLIRGWVMNNVLSLKQFGFWSPGVIKLEKEFVHL